MSMNLTPDKIKVSLLLEGRQLFVVDQAGNKYPVFRKMEKPGRIHVMFKTAVWDSTTYWGVCRRAAEFTARRYLHYHSVVGGSGHNNVSWIRNRRGS